MRAEMPHRVLSLFLAVVAVPAASASAAVPSASPAPRAAAAATPFGFVPSRPGSSSVFGYQLDTNGARGTQYLHGVIVITRLQGNRALIAIGPEAGAGNAVVVTVAADGTLHAAQPAPSEALNRGSAAPIPPGVRALSALLVTPEAGASWPVSAEAGDATVPTTIGLTGRTVAQNGERTISADGTATITVAQLAAPGEGRSGGYSRGGGRGGFPGGGGGMGGPRRGGESASEPGAAAAQRIPATLVLHVEATFRGSTFLGARGTEQTTPTQGNDKTPSSVSWSIFPY